MSEGSCEVLSSMSGACCGYSKDSSSTVKCLMEVTKKPSRAEVSFINRTGLELSTMVEIRESQA